MVSVSDAWKEVHKERLLPESFVEISVGISDVGATDTATVTGENEAVFSNTEAITGRIRTSQTRYATLEHNLWVLDGSHNIMPDLDSYSSPGYASNGGSASVTLATDEVREMTVPGFTITWSSEYGEYPTKFTVMAWNSDNPYGHVGYVIVNNNTSNVSEVDLAVTGYDRVTVTVNEWNQPDHRARLDRFAFGHSATFTKNDILNFTHEQTGCINSGEIPKSSITFSLDNSDGKWNPYNPQGIGKYLKERQPVTVRYGLNVNGSVEWIDAGRFYLSDWNAPANGLEATFTARDVFEYLLNTKNEVSRSGTLTEIVRSVTTENLPTDVAVNIDSSLDFYTAEYADNGTLAEIVQRCANAAGCVIRIDRAGDLNIEPLNRTPSDYVVKAAVSYAHPETTLSKLMKDVSVRYGENKVHVLPVNTTGETQTVDNTMIVTDKQAEVVSLRVKHALESRKTVSGEFRADPRLDVFDIVTVESKYGVVESVVITNVRYTYSGAFRGTYTGRVVDGTWLDVLGKFVLGTSVLC